jgi:WhiB family redox-sensing transcriptional regulator
MSSTKRPPRLTSVPRPPEQWKARGACNGAADPDAWFPEFGTTGRLDRDERTLAALRTCGGCFVRFECLRYAMENNERYGIWGGMTEQQRTTLRRQARRRGADSGDAA